MTNAGHPLHIKQLRDEFERRTHRNSSYSLRAFARDLGISPAALSSVLNFKKGLSQERALQIAVAIGLTKKEQDLFVLSSASLHARSQTTRQQATEKLKTIDARKTRANKVESENFGKIQNWYHLALLELVELPECKHTTEWFAKRLALNPIVIRNALQRLVEAGLLEQNGKRYVALTPDSETDMDLPSKAIQNYHAEILERATDSLHMDPVLEREFLSMTFAFSRSDMEDAKEMIRDFQRAFAERFYSNSKKQKDSVYQLSIQYFRLDRKEEK